MKNKFTKGILIINSIYMLSAGIRAMVIGLPLWLEFGYIGISMISLGMAMEDS